MWGSTLADFAKKAKEQADQLSSANVNLNDVSNNFTGAFSAFNLDAMRSEDNGGNEATEEQEVENSDDICNNEAAGVHEMSPQSDLPQDDPEVKADNDEGVVLDQKAADERLVSKPDPMMQDYSGDNDEVDDEGGSSSGGWDNENFEIEDEDEDEQLGAQGEAHGENIDAEDDADAGDIVASEENGPDDVKQPPDDENGTTADTTMVDDGDQLPSPTDAESEENSLNETALGVEDASQQEAVESEPTDVVQEQANGNRLPQSVNGSDDEVSVAANDNAAANEVMEDVDDAIPIEVQGENVASEAEDEPVQEVDDQDHQAADEPALVSDTSRSETPKQEPSAPIRNFAVEALLQRAAAVKKEEPVEEAAPPVEDEITPELKDGGDERSAEPQAAVEAAPQFIDPDDMPSLSQNASAPSSGNFDVGGLFSTMFSSSAKKPEVALSRETKPALVPAPKVTNQQNGHVDIEAMKRDHESTIKRFVEQIQRLDAHHTTEMSELTAKYDAQMAELRSVAGSSEEAQQLKKKLRVANDKVESLEMKLEQEKTRSGHVEKEMDRRVAEKAEKIKGLQEDLEASNEKIASLEKRVAQAEEDSSVAQEQYDTLKTRVKSVATELKERRIECRTLGLQAIELETSNKSLKEEMDRLQLELAAKVSQIEEATNVGKEHQDRVASLEETITSVQKQMLDEKKRGEKALAAYKAKSVKALGDAQRRVASANQAKAESETELEVLRAHVEEMQSTMDEMSDRVEDRLRDSKDVIASLEQMLVEKEAMVGEIDAELSETKAKLEELEANAKKSGTEVAQIQAEWEDVQCAYQKEVDRNRELARANTELEQQAKNLKSEMNILREEYEDLEAEIASGGKRRSKRPTGMENGSSNGDAGYNDGSHMNGSGQHNHQSADGHDMVAILQEELVEANSAIKGLKEALRQALKHNGKHSSNRGASLLANPAANGVDDDDDASDCSSNISATGDLVMRTAGSQDTSYADISLREGDTSPEEGDQPQNALFYAFEKQAELHTARDEINRLANLVGTVQAEKQEAIERVDQLRRSLEDTEAKLNRQSKLLGTAGGRDAALSNPEEVANAATANLEYLKHVMLRYLRAKTSAEKKNLIPVISAVLCLTADEMKGVEAAINESGGLTGIGNAFFESLESLSGKGNTGSHAASSQASSARPQGSNLW